jgi:sterol desaturase/sphingolipid hydroxylase (fatty acid hydroxylase superfamily)
MDLLIDIGQSWFTTAKWVGGLGLVFAVLARLMPCNPGMYWWKGLRAALTDLIYWFIVPIFLGYSRTVLLIVGIVVLYAGREPEFLPVKDWPMWLQFVLILLLEDVILYWIHRAFHSRAAWRFHAIHHSPTTLDWLSTMRTHPVNYILEFTLADVTILLLGFSPEALVLVTLFSTPYSSMVHANLNWTFGPLRYLFASPVFHRWHHTTQAAGLDKNFASTFPFLDLLFGTYYMPRGTRPEQFGIDDAEFPEGFLGQLAYPFRKAKPAPRPAAVPAPSRRRRRAA